MVRKAMIAVAIGAFAVFLTGCDHNTSGTGNEFKIRAVVDHAGKSSITVRDVQVLESYGKAGTWFHGKHQIHDNYNTCGFGSSRHHVGDAYDDQQNWIPLRSIPPGAIVEVTGSIRENASTCGKNENWSWRPVFEYLTEKGTQ